MQEERPAGGQGEILDFAGGLPEPMDAETGLEPNAEMPA
jgi:hypothetical protein